MLEKLVRDRIPEIMRRARVAGQFRVAQRPERLRLLLAKLLEEAAELECDPGLYEFVDVIEVVRAIQCELGLSNAQIETERAQKEASKGAFSAGVVLQLPD